jgi:hypothetical protein
MKEKNNTPAATPLVTPSPTPASLLQPAPTHSTTPSPMHHVDLSQQATSHLPDLMTNSISIVLYVVRYNHHSLVLVLLSISDTMIYIHRDWDLMIHCEAHLPVEEEQVG